MQRRINHARNLVDKVESKCMLTSSNLRITVAIAQVMCSHMQARGMHACMQIQESTKGGYSMYMSGGMLWKMFEILMPRESFWCNLRLDARLETTKWLFLD